MADSFSGLALDVIAITTGDIHLTSSCIVPGCKNATVVHALRAWDHRIGQEAHCCIDHLEGFLKTYYASNKVGEGAPKKYEGGIVFDVELLLFDDRSDKLCQVSLREVGGTRRLDCGIGIFEASALRWQLEPLNAPRPLTHAVIASVISALDGELEYVTVDKFFPDQPVTLEAKLHIRRGRDFRVVDVRPSDAFTLAVICEAPIVVLHDVLKNL